MPNNLLSLAHRFINMVRIGVLKKYKHTTQGSLEDMEVQGLSIISSSFLCHKTGPMKKLQDFLLLTSQATFFGYFKRNFTNNILSKYHLGKTIPKFHSVHWVISPLFFAKPPITYSNYSSPPFYAILPTIYWFLMNSPTPPLKKKKSDISVNPHIKIFRP